MTDAGVGTAKEGGQGLVALPPKLLVRKVPFPNYFVQQYGHELDSVYVERSWLPVLGPTTLLLLRRIAYAWGSTTLLTLDTEVLASAMGLGYNASSNRQLPRAFMRLTQFGLAEWAQPDGGGGHINVYSKVPELSERHLRRLHPEVRHEHTRLVNAYRATLPRLEPTS